MAALHARRARGGAAQVTPQRLGGLAMVVIGLCHTVLAAQGGMTSLTSSERVAPTLCAAGIVSEFLFGYPGYFVINAIWPNFYFTPVDAGKWTWLGIQGVSIA